MTGTAGMWLVDPSVLPAFLLAMVLIELTPGPNMGYLALVSTVRGRLAGLLTIVGVTVGLGLYLMLALYGLTKTPLASAGALTALKWAGVGYMLWLAIEALLPERSVQSRPLRLPFAAGRLMLRGLVANLLNPKAALFYMVMLPGFVRPEFAAPRTQMLVFGGIHIGISIMVHLAIVVGAAGTASHLPASGRRLLRWGLATGLAATALWVGVAPR